MPVLFYCSEQTKDYLETQGQSFISADISEDDEEEDNDDVLKALDVRDSTTGEYRLVIATDPDAMRGVDYRAPLTGITLLIGKSFANAREADQGLKRVGRFKDSCQRIAIDGTPLVDPELEASY